MIITKLNFSLPSQEIKSRKYLTYFKDNKTLSCKTQLSILV